MKHEKSVNWSSGVWIKSSERVVCVTEEGYKKPIFKKIPGGRQRPADETPEDTAVRELYEETGLLIRKEQLQLIAQQFRNTRSPHMYYLYAVEMPDKVLDETFSSGFAKNGEKVHVLSRHDLRAEEFLPIHKDLLTEHKLWPN